MPKKERELLLKINAQVIKLQEAPASTFSPQTGEVEETGGYQPVALPTITLPVGQSKRDNPPASEQ